MSAVAEPGRDHKRDRPRWRRRFLMGRREDLVWNRYLRPVRDPFSYLLGEDCWTQRDAEVPRRRVQSDRT